MPTPSDIGGLVIGISPAGDTTIRLVYADEVGNQIGLNMTTDTIYIRLSSGFNLYLGGDGVTGVYGNVQTTAGICSNIFARVDAP